MRGPFLTGSWRTNDDRRTATCLMTVLSIAAASPSAARADERPPPSLIERALRTDSPGETVSERALAASPWIPALRVGAVVEHGAYSKGGRVDTTFYGALIWPLGRTQDRKSVV